MEFDFMEWVSLALRWTHIFAGIMWVGATYFFTWLDGRFTDLMNTKSDEKHVWMVHSGGFYKVEKQKIPDIMPKTLHWFKWEAAITWLSGFLMLLYVYYYGGLMVDETMNETTAILVGLGVIVFCWPVYDNLWKSPLGRNEILGATVCGARVRFGLRHGTPRDVSSRRRDARITDDGKCLDGHHSRAATDGERAERRKAR
jgi:uncharacterized membrane protein